jgi:hypothetical protein
MSAADATHVATCRTCGGRVYGTPQPAPEQVTGSNARRGLFTADPHPCATASGWVRTDAEPVER